MRYSWSLRPPRARRHVALLQRAKSSALHPTSGKRTKNGTTTSTRSRRRLTSQYQPPLPAFRILPTPRVSRNTSSGARSCCETLKAAESRQRPDRLPRSAAPDHEAGLSQRKPGEKRSEGDRYGLDGRPFLLIACITRHVFTVLSTSDRTSSAGCPGVPAYSRLLQLPRSTDSYGRRLPGLSFAASLSEES